MDTRKIGYIIFAHGSRAESANAGVRLVSAEFATRLAQQQAGVDPLFETAFLELAQPDLATAVDTLAVRGATEICVLPYFLTLGMHLQRDLPELAAAAAAKHPLLEIKIAPPLHGHPGLAGILLERAAELERLAEVAG
jgi:sirohydrochlorin ferrochelatase